MFGGSKKDKGFSHKGKIQQYHGDGVETIIMMGKPFRVLQKLSDETAPYMAGQNRHRIKAVESTHASYVFLVENSARMTEFPRHLALKRSFYPVDEVQEAHKEIEVMSRIKDKNIVRVYHSEISRSEGKLGVSIAMEYCGNNLFRRIRSGASGGAGTRLSESEICHVMLAMTSALGYLHSQQPPIAHRDIRPENVLINNNQTGPAAYKLCNFSSSTTDAYQCETREEASMAINDIEAHTNPAFRSPEMADPWSKKRICEKSDMWSLGVLVYYMMYLKLPFEATNMALSNNPKVRFPTGAGYDNRYCGSLRLIVEHLLDPDPESRWDVFSLTNFLRFDEDVSRHLGTFCFTRTEYPEGWEEQDVKVLNRDVPTKPAPVTYNDHAGHMHVNDDRKAGEERRAAVAAGNGRDDSESSSPSPQSRRGAATAAASSAGRTPSFAMGDDAVREAMMVLGGGGDDDDPEMAEYRKMIIREQEEAWARLKGQSGKSGTAATTTASAAAPASSGASVQSPPPPPPPKKDLFDDLFSGPAQPEPPQQPSFAPVSQPAQAASTTASPNPQPLPPQQQQQAPPKADVFSADDLFTAPAQPQQQPAGMGYGGNAGAYGMLQQQQQQQPPLQQGMGYGMQQQQQQGIYGGGAGNTFGGNWGTGMPAGMMGQPQQQLQQTQPWNSGYQPQQHQPQQQQVNFMAPSAGQQYTAPQQQPQAPPTAVPEKKKDPFADLFS